MRLSACWTVTAGVIPGQPMEEYQKTFVYTSEDKEADANVPEGEMNKFTTLMLQAHDYAKTITQPQYVNWVNVEFMWM